MRLPVFSPKQAMVMSWWIKGSEEGIICDGAVRSGKTFSLALSYFLWGMTSFSDCDFALCGRTVGAVRRNLLRPITPLLIRLGLQITERRQEGYWEVKYHGRKNRFYLFGGYNEASAALIQGMTLAGVLFDEVVLMPRSFVEQGVARCSVSGSRLWFCCNPAHPGHWFYKQWIEKAVEKKLCYLHFTMEDNPSLSKETKERYRRLYTGDFYRRFVLGEWCAPQGLVYPGFSREMHLAPPPPRCTAYWISCDYGMRNPTSMGLWGEWEGVWYRLAEYYHDPRQSGEGKTDEDYYSALCALAGETPIERVVVDPSALSFIQCIAHHGRFAVQGADNRVLEGIGKVSQGFGEGWLRICPCCEHALEELGLYHWEEQAVAGGERPCKENDHAMDEMRYFVMAVKGQKNAFATKAVARNTQRRRP